jgi:hypothetical protein
MASVTVTKVINASAMSVWGIVSEWDGTHKWIPGVGPVTVEGEGVGSIRSADLDPATGFEGRISERLVSWDEGLMTFSYQAIGDGPLPVENYVAVMRVEARTEGDSSVTWSSTWEPIGRDEEEIREMFAGLYSISLDNVATALK